MSISFFLSSGDKEEYPGCRLFLRLFSWSKSIHLPAILKPATERQKFTFLTPEQIEAHGCDYYLVHHERRIGFNYFSDHGEGFTQIWLGGKYTQDSDTDQTISFFIPWMQWRFVRKTVYGLNGEHFWTSKDNTWKEWEEVESIIPKARFRFKDFDGEEIEATTYISEREWRKGEDWFEWVSLFHAPKASRSLEIEFSAETGRRKGSWKGGITGHGIEMKPEELHEQAFRRYCDEHEMEFLSCIQE